jgi:hypothetical protein
MSLAGLASGVMRGTTLIRNTTSKIDQSKIGSTRRDPEQEDPIDSLLNKDPRLVQLGRLIRRHQHELRSLCSDEAWRSYVRIEELLNERTFSLADILLRGSP